MRRMLIVDDDDALAARLQYYLQEQGYWVDLDLEGAGRLQAEIFRDYSLILLEVQLESRDGFELLRQIRRVSTVPVIVLTRLGAEADCITSLALGADEYVVKPCSPPEIAARVRAVLRRAEPPTPEPVRSEVFRVGRLLIWPEECRAQCGDETLALTDIEFKLLERLAQDVGRPVSKGDLSQYALGKPLPRRNRSIDARVTAIRRKLGPRPDGHPYVQAVRFDGYRLLEN